MSRYLQSSLLLLYFYASASAQTTFGSITGVVTDKSSAVIPGAQVTVTNQDTGGVRHASSGAGGVYTFTDLLPGPYRLNVEQKGFNSLERSDIVLFANGTVNIDVQLDVGSASTKVEVSGAAPVINTETATTTYAKIGEHLEDMPILLRQSHGNLGVAVYNPGTGVNNSANIYANGVRQLDSVMSNDGIVEMADPDGVGGGQIGPDLDGVAEINYILANAPAEFRSPVNFTTITKSGTNEFHGSAFYEINNTVLNARQFFSATVPVHIYNDFVFSAGGPIRKNKTFFFADWDQESNHSQTVVTANTPLVAWRSGTFSSAVKDPLTGQPFPNNQIPSSRISPASLAAQNYFYPLPNFGGPTLQSGNWRGIHPGIGTPKTTDGRVDQIFSEREAVFARVSYKHVASITAAAFMPPLGTGYQKRDSSTAVLSWTHTFSPNLVNEARGGFARNYNLYYPDSIGSNIISQLGIQGISTTGIHGVPYIAITGLTGTNQSSDGLSLDTNFEGTDNVSWTRGGHSLKFGFDVIVDRIGGYTVPAIYGNYSFTTAYTGVAYADFLLGLPQQTTLVVPTPNQYQRGSFWSTYAQDQWKLTSRLTLNYGLRWELQGPYYDNYGRIVSFDPKTGSLVVPDNGVSSINPLYPRNIPIETATQAGYPDNSLLRFPKNNFYPRFGAAYKLTADGKTAIRGGYGIYGNTIYGSIAQSLTGGPFSGNETFTNTAAAALAGGSAPLLTFTNPFGTGAGGKAAALQNINGIYPDIRTPYTQQWNVTLEKQVRSIGISVAYIGSHSVSLLYPRNLNQPLPSTKPFSGCLYPALNTITWVDNGGSESYNSLQLAASRAVGKNLTFMTAFTWAKDLTDQLDSANFAGQTIQNAYDRSSERGNNTYTVPLRYFGDVVYAFPVGKGQAFLHQMPRVANAILGGWRLSSTFVLQTGQFFTPSFAGSDPSGTNHIGGRPDVVPGVSVIPSGGQTIYNWVNLSAFAIPPANVGRFGNAGNNILQGPPMRNIDLALIKDFHLTERLVMQFDAQAGNAFNHPNFGNPTANISSPATGAAITSLLVNYLQGSGAARTFYFMLRLRF